MTEPSKLPHHGVPEHQPAAGGIAARARAAAVPQYLAGLNPGQREAVVLCHYQELGNIEAAAVMGVTVEALESLLSRGRRSLRAALADLVER